MMKTVVLRSVYAYYCEECGEENYIHPIPYEDPENQVPVEIDEHGNELHGQWYTIPEVVKCKSCNCSFKTKDEMTDRED